MKRLLWIAISGLLLAGCAHQQPVSTIAPEDSLRAAQLNVQLGMTYLQQQQMDLAKQKLLKAVALDPNLPDAHYSLGYYFDAVGQTQDAQREYQTALKLAPNNPQVLNSYGVFLCKTKQYALAEQYFQQALAQIDYTDVGLTYQNAGLCAMDADNQKAALTYFTQAIQQNPKLALPYLKVAELQYAQQNYSQAMVNLNQYHQLTQPTAESLHLAIQLAQQADDDNQVASLRLQLQSLK
jgi:type IV pilus assembly protein PilF